MDNQMKLKIDELGKKLGHTSIIDMGDGIFGKIEGENPAGSIKDRAAYYIIKRALENGDLQVDGTIVEATSGNTGIGLAFIARELGLHAVMAMPDSMSAERRAMIASYGAELVLTPAALGMVGAVEAAKKICKERGAFIANQFGNYASVEAHFYTTAPEIFSQVKDVKFVVAGVGSGGTVMGIKKFIESNKFDCKIVAVEPLSSPLLSKGVAGPHKIQGIGANFVPDLVKIDKLDMINAVSNEDAFASTKEIYQKFNIKCGISSGAAYFVAKQLRNTENGNIVVVLPDNGDRYPDSLYI